MALAVEAAVIRRAWQILSMLAWLSCLVLGAAACAWAADDTPALNTTEGRLTVAAGLLWALIGLWNRRGTKTVETKTDDQTKILGAILEGQNLTNHHLNGLSREVADLRVTVEDNDKLTTDELANLGESVSDLKAGHTALRSTVDAHGRTILALTDGLARVQTAVNLRGTDKALAGGTVAALTPSGGREDCSKCGGKNVPIEHVCYSPPLTPSASPKDPA